MSISPTENERAAIFQTPVLRRQIQKYVRFRGEIPRKELSDFFATASKRTFDAALWALKKRGALLVDEDDVYTIGEADEIVASRADRAWKAARMMRTFTAKGLAITAGVDHRYVVDLCSTWAAHNWIVRVGQKDRDFLYKMYSREVLRPRVARKTEVENG